MAQPGDSTVTTASWAGLALAGAPRGSGGTCGADMGKVFGVRVAGGCSGSCCSAAGWGLRRKEACRAQARANRKSSGDASKRMCSAPRADLSYLSQTPEPGTFLPRYTPALPCWGGGAHACSPEVPRDGCGCRGVSPQGHGLGDGRVAQGAHCTGGSTEGGRHGASPGTFHGDGDSWGTAWARGHGQDSRHGRIHSGSLWGRWGLVPPEQQHCTMPSILPHPPASSPPQPSLAHPSVPHGWHQCWSWPVTEGIEHTPPAPSEMPVEALQGFGEGQAVSTGTG